MMARVARNLVAYEPTHKGLRFAGVSIIVRDGKSPSVLLIRRVERAGDPWSGQIAFPGGKMQPEDGSVRDTAIRETLEEVGIDLNRAAEFLGYAGVMTTHTGTMEVVPSVFVLKEWVKVKHNEEVASYRWVDLKDIQAPGARSTYGLEYDGKVVGMPAYAVGDYLIWGLTYRILSSLFEGPA